MDLLTLLFRLPFMPVKGFIKLAELIDEEAQRQYHDPAAVRRRLEEAEEARASGRATDEEVAAAESEAVGRLVDTGSPAGGSGLQREEN